MSFVARRLSLWEGAVVTAANKRSSSISRSNSRARSSTTNNVIVGYRSCCRSFSAVSSSSSSSDSVWYDQIPPEIESVIAEHARQQPTSASLQMLMKTGRGSGDFWGRSTHHSSSNKRGIQWGRLGQRLASERILLQLAAYLRNEIPVRLAHRIQDLDQCPHMRDMEAVQAVKAIYIHSFLDLTNFPPSHTIQTMADEQAFAELLASLYKKHASVLVQMAQGAYQLREEIRMQQKEQRRIYFLKNAQKRYHPLRDGSRRDHASLHSIRIAEEDANSCFERMEECHQFLDRFYMSRIGIRFLAGQYLTLRNANTSSSINDPQQLVTQQHFVGMICQKTSPSQCVRQAAADASMMCRRTYGRCPRVEVTGRLDLTFPYIPAYLHYILLELLKNALRATMEQHMHSSAALPPVEVIIADGTENEDVVIKIADEGGGIPRSQVDKIWSYLFTTADPKIQDSFIGVKTANNLDHSKESPLAGLGYGLPISRSYCRYFGGDLDLISMEGFGTDAFVHLKRLGDSEEPVPV